jgi:hypothetical protein
MITESQLAEEGVTDAGPINPFEFNEAEVRKDFEAYRSLGVTLEDIRTEAVEGWKYMNLRVAFASLAGLGQTEFLSDRQLTLTRLAEGRYELVQAAPPGTGEATQEMDTELLAGLMKGFRAELRVEVPGARRGIQCRRTGAVRRPPGFLMWIAMPSALERAQRAGHARGV